MPEEAERSKDLATSSSAASAELKPSVFLAGQKALPELFSLAKTLINLVPLRKELEGYDPGKASAIFNGFTYGFPLYYSGQRAPTDAKN